MYNVKRKIVKFISLILLFQCSINASAGILQMEYRKQKYDKNEGRTEVLNKLKHDKTSNNHQVHSKRITQTTDVPSEDMNISNVSSFRRTFNRHYIIVIDQTIKANDFALKIIYNSLHNWFLGKAATEQLNLASSIVPPPIKFDTSKDAISLFAFGLPGDGKKMNSEYGRIHKECFNGSASRDYLYKDIVHSLIHKRSRYFCNGLYTIGNSRDKDISLEEFLNSELYGLFNCTDQLHKNITRESGITMSHFIFPFIVNFISKDETSNEYYLILVSDFKSGQYSNNDADDWNTLKYLVSGKNGYVSYIQKQVNELRDPFVQADFMFLKANDLGAKGTRIILKNTVKKSQVYFTTSLSLSQNNELDFTLSSSKIAFEKDENTKIDSVVVVINDKKGEICHQKILESNENIMKCFDDSRREYEIDNQDVTLSRMPNGDVSVSYVLYTMSYDAAGNKILPVALTATQDINGNDISTVNKELRKTMTVLSIILLTGIILAVLYWRGLKKTVDYTISKFAQKYVNVTKDCGAIELPCWFYTRGNNSTTVHVSGKLKSAKAVSLGGSKILFVRLQEAKPDGFSYFINRQRCEDFTPVHIDKDGKFDFNIDININPDIVHPMRKLYTCGLMIDFRAETKILGLLAHSDIGICKEDFNFYCIEDLGRAWVGFDPGTSGSCIALGTPSGALNNPNIDMVKETFGSVSSNIIPSKLILDGQIANKNTEQLIPGKDYKYGIEADQQWRAAIASDLPHFQSIKKLLGYKKAADDMIEVKSKGKTVEFSGVDLAHLLVKGLNQDLKEYIHNLTPDERMRLADIDANPKRAVVAIPNNYTLPKIQDMVNSISRLGQFKEVRYIYEAEGILFNYLRKTFGTIQNGSETVMVYDMGGATINLTVFKIDYIKRNGSTYYKITTLARIGYAVGGDNIDVALMEYCFTLANKSEKERHKYEQEHKTEILQAIFGFKLNLIYYSKNVTKEKGKVTLSENKRDVENLATIYNKSLFESFLTKLLGGFGELNLENMSDDDFIDKIYQKIIESSQLKKIVYAKVNDAVTEIMKYPEVVNLSKIDKLIFAGRSTNFPFIRSNVEKIVLSKNNNIQILNLFDDAEIKTSVAYGACWYGIYNGLVTLDNSRLSSAYGYKQTTGTDTNLNILLSQNSIFGENNKVYNEDNVESLFDGDGQSVAFYQIMGSGKGKDLLSKENRYKVNYLTSIPVTSLTKAIGMEVNRNNVVDCKVKFDTGETVTYSDVDIETRDITQENDWAYTFATENKEIHEERRYEPYKQNPSQVQTAKKIEKNDRRF